MLRMSLFAIAVVMSSNVFGATGDGHAQVELLNPLTITNQTTLDFGQIAIDPGSGAQTLSMAAGGTVTCPTNYVCSGTTTNGELLVTGAPGGSVNLSITGQTATLDDGGGNTLTFDPVFVGDVDTLSSVPLDGTTGQVTIDVGGAIDFAGTEIAGTYTSVNGSAYVVTVNY